MPSGEAGAAQKNRTFGGPYVVSLGGTDRIHQALIADGRASPVWCALGFSFPIQITVFELKHSANGDTPRAESQLVDLILAAIKSCSTFNELPREYVE